MTVYKDKEGIDVHQASFNELGLRELKDTIYQSNFIKTHNDYYQWKQQCVCRFIPHDILVAGWGDFAKGNLQFDISSSLADVHAQQRTSGRNEIEPLMKALFCQWEENGDQPIFNEEFNISQLNLNYSAKDKIMTVLTEATSILVYGFRDKRSNSDVLYAFFNFRAHEKTDKSVIDMIMPHLDSALRRIECLPNNNTNVLKLPTMLYVISERESMVLSLVVQGKTNIEIARILFISVNTVKNHLKNIFKKMNVSSRAEAVAKYLNRTISQENNDMDIKNIFVKTS